MSDKLKKFLEEQKRKEAEQAEQEEASQEFTEHVPKNEYERTQSDIQLDQWIENLSITDAYNKWIRKSKPDPRNRRKEGLMISCPNPWHEDTHPSAWMNTDKKVWYCGKCNVGGDIYDFAAIHFKIPNYKEGANFRKLREEMAKSFGFVFMDAPGLDKPVILPPHAEDQEQLKPKLAVVSDEPDPEEENPDNVVSIDDDDEETEDELQKDLPSFDWTDCVEPGTFLDTYMRQTIIDDVPDEYNFWNAMMALGLAVGRDCKLYDRTPVLANIFVCLVGYTGDGKSRSFRHLYDLLTAALPFDAASDMPKGVQVIKTPNSAEVLVHSFDHRAIDLSTGSPSTQRVPVRGLVEYNEMAALVGRTMRTGTSTIKPTVMEFFDSPDTISFRSMKYAAPIVAKEPFAGMFTTAQPALFKLLFDDADINSGFMNRWIFATGQRKDSIAIGGEVVDITPCVKPIQAIHGWAGYGRDVLWSNQANAHFTDFFHNTLDPARKSDPLLMRIDLTIKKLILLFAINEQSDEIQVSHVDKAIAMYDYLTMIYDLLGIEVRKSPFSEMRRDIIDRLARATKKNPRRGVSLRELKNMIQKRDYDPNHVIRVIDAYKKLGIIRVEEPNKNMIGRPTVRYFYEA